MDKTDKEKLIFEEKKWMKISFLAGLSAFISLVLTNIFFPNVVVRLASVWLTLFCTTFGITVGIMYIHKVLQKGEM